MQIKPEVIAVQGKPFQIAQRGEGALIFCVHGFPESWYSWRHQIEGLSQAGYRVVAVDVRGYGKSYAPLEVEAYDLDAITTELAAIISHIAPGEQAILLGHDHGAPMVWNMALRFPDLIRAVAGLSIPHLAPGKKAGIDVFHDVFTKKGKFFYQVYFQEPGIAEAEIEADIPAFVRKFFYANSGDAPVGSWPFDKVHGDSLLHRLPEPELPLPWLVQEDVDYYASQFALSGLHGPLNRYRNHYRDYAFLKGFSSHVIQQPALYIGGDRDLALKIFPGNPVETQKQFFADLRGATLLAGCGHWTQQERPKEVNRLLLEWLSGL